MFKRSAVIMIEEIIRQTTFETIDGEKTVLGIADNTFQYFVFEKYYNKYGDYTSQCLHFGPLKNCYEVYERWMKDTLRTL